MLFWRQMKKAAVPTTTARGAAVSSSSATAVQSVYIASGQRALTIFSGTPMHSDRRCRIPQGAPRRPRLGPWAGGGALQLALLAGALAGLAAAPGQADVRFENCQPTGDGGLSCDTRPSGNTLMDDEAARFGLFDQASPGWSEFEPDAGDDGMVGGNQT